MITNSIELLKKAREGGYAVGAFNAYDMESAQAIIWAAEKVGMPVILQTSQTSLEYAGFDTLSSIIFMLAQKAKVPVVTHLDHGTDIKLIKQAIESEKYTSVMFDGSKLPFSENVKATSDIVNSAHRKHITVEAELGIIQSDKTFSAQKTECTDPRLAAEFTVKTKCDSLAVAFGNVHGEKVEGEKLNFDALKLVAESVDVPLVFHGASNSTAAEFKKVIEIGIAKINIDTQLRQAFVKSLQQKSKQKDPRAILDSARAGMEKVVADCLREFSPQ